jgi:hypothetical protein
MKLLVVCALALGCRTPATPTDDLPMPDQIKSERDLVIHTIAVSYALTDAALSIDGREIPIAGDGPRDRIAQGIARVAPELRALIHTIAISPTPSPLDAMWTKKYKLPVLAGMTSNADGNITIYPHGIDELADPDGFVRNLLHELGHTWSLRAWHENHLTYVAWLTAIASDRVSPSRYAALSFKSSGEPSEDAAEATALYFAVRATPLFERYRAAMPARFALIDARFGIHN